MSYLLRPMTALAIAGAVALSAPAEAKDLIIVDGPITAKDVKCDNCVQRRDIGSRAVTAGKMRNNAVSSAKIQGGAVTTGKIGDAAVTTDKIADGAVTEAKLAFGVGGDIAPFRVLNSTGGLCDGPSSGASNPVIQIDNLGVDEFVVTSILIRTSGAPVEGFVALRIENLEVNNFRFDTRTDDLVGPTFSQTAVFDSADLMGTPVLTSSRVNSPGGNFPHQIVASANSDGADIEVTLLCESDFEPFSIEAIAVSGWKQSGDTVTVTYIPGS